MFFNQINPSSVQDTDGSSSDTAITPPETIHPDLTDDNDDNDDFSRSAAYPSSYTVPMPRSTFIIRSGSDTGNDTGSDAVVDANGPLGLNTLFDPAEPALADLIFVHGLTGGSRGTWTKSNNLSLYWPKEWLPHDDAFRDVRIHSFGYDTNWDKERTLNITDFAKSLLIPLVLVGHSMGGQVIKHAFILAKKNGMFASIAQRVRTIFFLATPHRGTDLAQFLAKILNHSSGSRRFETEQHRDSLAIPSINDEFRHHCNDLQIYSFYETLPITFGVNQLLVLEKNRATLGYPNERISPLNANHSGVCKYDSTSDPNYRTVRNALASAFESIRNGAVLSQRDLDNEQKKVLGRFLGESDAHEADFILIDSRRLAGSCEWLTSKESFQVWQNSPQTQMYWMSAKPATGKTVLSGKMIAHLRSLNCDCAFYFFKSGDKSRSTITSFLLSMAWQMSSHSSEALSIVLDICEKDRQLSKGDYRTIWRKLFLDGILTIQFLRPQYWVIDALDECIGGHELVPMLLKVLSTGQVRIFLTSRNLFESYSHIAHSDARVISEEILANDTESDIALYLKANMHELLVDESAQQEIVSTILDRSAGSFLWVTLVMQKLSQAYTHAEIRSILESVPSDMNELFSNDQSEAVKVESTFAISGKHGGSIADDRASSVGSTWVNKSTVSRFSRPEKEVPSVDSGYMTWTYQPSTGSQNDKIAYNQPPSKEEHSVADIEQVEREEVLSQKSVESFEEGISFMAESLIGNDIRNVAQTLILEILENDEVLNALLRESLEKFDRHRVIKNLAGFIHGYCVLLSNAQPTLNQKRTIRFFRRRRTQFASILCNNLHPSTLGLNERIADEKSKALAAERKARLARWAADDSGNVSPTPSVDGDDSDNHSDESWSSSEGLPPILEDMKVFLMNGEPFELFRQNFARFVAGESIKDWNSMIKSNLQLHRGREVDCTKAPTISSSPLPTTDFTHLLEAKRDSIVEIENHGGFKVSWGCRCGRRFEAQIAGSDRRAAEDFLQRMDWKVERDGPMVTHCFNLQWLENLLWVLAPNLLGRFSYELPSIGTESEDLEARQDSNLPQSMSNPTNRGQQGVGTQMGRHSAVIGADAKRDLVYVCLFNRKSNNWRLKHAKVYRSSNIKLSETQEGEGKKITQNMDKALFLALRERLVGVLKGTSWFSPFVITGLEFWEFKLFYMAKLVKRVQKDKLPYERQATEPESLDPNSTLQLEDWEYNLLTGQKLSDYKEILQSEFLLHLLKFPEDAHPQSPVWAGLPRKIRTKLINRQPTPKVGWGFSVDHEWNALAFTVSMCPIIIAGFVLAIYLAIRDKWPMSAAITLALAPVTLIAFLNTMLKDVMKQKNLSK